MPGVSDNSNCLAGGLVERKSQLRNHIGRRAAKSDASISIPIRSASLNNEGHNYFLSQNPYVLNSYAGFGEAYYNVTPDLKLTGGLRWTDDQKHFIDIPSELLVPGYGYPVTGVVDQQWNQWTGRVRRQLDAEARFHRSDTGLCAPMRMATRPAAPIRRARHC